MFFGTMLSWWNWVEKVIKLQLLKFSSCGFKLTRALCFSLFIKCRCYYKEVAHVVLGARKSELHRAGRQPGRPSKKSWCGNLVSVLWQDSCFSGKPWACAWIVCPYNKVTCIFSFVIMDKIKRIWKLYEEKEERIKMSSTFLVPIAILV